MVAAVPVEERVECHSLDLEMQAASIPADSCLMDVGFMFDSYSEKVTCDFQYGEHVLVTLSYVQDEPGALQSGHYVWPAAPSLCEYLVKEWGRFPSGNVVELGAGCGLAGLAIAQLDPKANVIFTDHDPGVLKTITHNVAQQTRPQGVCLTQSLRWGPDGINEIDAIEKLQGQKKTNLIVGTDVIYAKEIVNLLFWTVNQLLITDKNHGMFLMCSSFKYDDETEKEIDAECAKYHLKREILLCTLNNNGTRIQIFTRL